MPLPSTPPPFVTPSCGFLGWDGKGPTGCRSFKGGACYPARTLGNTAIDAEAVGLLLQEARPLSSHPSPPGRPENPEVYL